MKRLKNITILLCFLSLLAFISCSAEDKTGVANNPPENDTEITDGETGGSSGTGSGGTGTSGETGGSGEGGTGTGGDSGSGTGTGGSGEGGSGSGSGSGEGGGGTETPPSPSEPEIVIEIEEKDFPPELFGTYRDERIYKMYKDERDDAKVSSSGIGIRIKGTEMRHKKDGSTAGTQVMDYRIKKWKKTTKGEKIIKVEGESLYTRLNEKNEEITIAKTVIIYDYENKTVNVTYTTYTPDGVDGSFYGEKIS